jgi:hypothetical protein
MLITIQKSRVGNVKSELFSMAIYTPVCSLLDLGFQRRITSEIALSSGFHPTPDARASMNSRTRDASAFTPMCKPRSIARSHKRGEKAIASIIFRFRPGYIFLPESRHGSGVRNLKISQDSPSRREISHQIVAGKSPENSNHPAPTNLSAALRHAVIAYHHVL